jgi:hypothetical protein
VIHATVQYPFPFSADFTYFLTVELPTLSIAVAQSKDCVLSWPQTPYTYSLESSSSLHPASWQAATNLHVSLSDGIYRATNAIGTANQFFRLRLN